MQWAIAEDLGLIPKDGPETCHHNFDLPWRGWIPGLATPRGIILNGNLEDIALTKASRAWNLAKEGSPWKAWAFLSGDECSTDRITAAFLARPGV